MKLLYCILVLWAALLLWCFAQTNTPPMPPSGDPPPMPPDYQPAPDTVQKSDDGRIYYVIPEHVTVRFQQRVSLTDTNWTDILIYKSSAKQGFYRVVIEQ